MPPTTVQQIENIRYNEKNKVEERKDEYDEIESDDGDSSDD